MVHGHLDIDGMRNRGFDLREHGPDVVHRIDDVGAGLAEDDDQNGWLAVGVARITDVFHGILRLADIGDSHGRSVAVSDH